MKWGMSSFFYLSDDEVLVESSVDVAVSGMDLVSDDKGSCQVL